MPEDKTAAAIRSDIKLLGVVMIAVLIALLFVATRESAGVRAEAALRALEITIQSHAQEEIARYSDLAARVRKSSTRKRWIERAIDRGDFPSVSQEEITQILEILDAQEELRNASE